MIGRPKPPLRSAEAVPAICQRDTNNGDPVTLHSHESFPKGGQWPVRYQPPEESQCGAAEEGATSNGMPIR